MRERAELIGGAFHLDSATGKGTTVTVEIKAEG
jgi:signal transduction histidine kinase